MTLPTTTEIELADHSPKPAVWVNRTDIIDIVLGCAFVCPIWLKYFLFGPLEWCRRSLTCWRIHPFVRKS
ncbi:DUF418 domain-containing protein [Lunatibacter salilacus]|uniref:DUF418 domain-containing protein n=1 Tax=Lunatibacter salilacus TaxID=2483804 RepID=UPI00131EB9CC|nr:DUF418 domain-containing protein [Lunatibacter salilacus]